VLIEKTGCLIDAINGRQMPSAALSVVGGVSLALVPARKSVNEKTSTSLTLL
jgi:hypothetical protein